MDILQKYNEENPEAPSRSPEWDPSQEYSFLIRLIMRLSGGKIQSVPEANVILIVLAVIIFSIAFIIVANPFEGGRPIPENMIYLPGQPPRLGPTITPQP